MKNIIATALLLITVAAHQPCSAQAIDLSKDTAATNFIANVTIVNMKEIKTGQLAQQKAKDKRVKDYGTRMVNDHTAATKELESILKSKNFTPPAPALPADSDADAMKKLEGTNFDQHYMTMMLTDHMNTIALFERASQNVQDVDIKTFAVKMLPKLRDHFTLARSIATKLNINHKGIMR